MSSFDHTKKLPSFLDTEEKWNDMVMTIDTPHKFDTLAFEILNSGIDTLNLRDILNDLKKDIERVKPFSAHIITDIVNPVNMLADSIVAGIKQAAKASEKMKFKNTELTESDETTCDCIEDEPLDYSRLRQSFNPPTYLEIQDKVEWKPVYAEFASFSDRIKTFSIWPKQLNPKPMELAEAGFFYTGKSDETVCFYCGLHLYHWKSTDNAKIEHKKFRSGCKFLNCIM